MAPDVLQQRDAALEQVRRIERSKARAFAKEARVLAELGELYQGDSGVLLELAGTARIGQVKAAGQSERARRLVGLFPRALALLEAGEMFEGTAQLLLAVTKNASERVQAEVDRRLSSRVAAMDAVDARALVAATVVEVESELEREEQERRYAQARANRGVWIQPVEDGMARIGAEVDAVAAKEFALGLEELDRAQQVVDEQDGVTRTKAQRMADLLVELPARYLALHEALRSGRLDQLLAQARSCQPAGAEPEPELDLGLAPDGPARPWDLERDELVVALLRVPVRRPRTLNVHAAASTLLDLDDQSCVVEGLGPLPGWMARTLLPDAALRRVLVDRATGLPLHLDDHELPVVELDEPHRPPDDPPGPRPRPPGAPPGGADPSVAERERRRLSALIFGPAWLAEAEPQYAPSARLRRLVQVRDLRCTGPGCARTATACDLDHEQRYADGGATAEWNLSAKSPRCHGARHGGWDVVRDPTTGVSTWTSPLGRVYTRLPAWRPPPSLPADVVLGPPVPRAAVPVESDYPTDRPLWPAPTPAPAPARRSGGLSWDNGDPPPF
jgi:hypothetical protein